MGDVIQRAPDAPTSGALYVVGTPIGNSEDLSVRALRILREADLIAAEDTRITQKLLDEFQIRTPMIAYHQHSGEERVNDLAERIAGGSRIALVSDAGMPGITDPGWTLIRRCRERSLTVIPIPGPVAAITALSASGLPAQRFAFDGFPARQRINKRYFFERLGREERTLVLYEVHHRLRETLEDLIAVLGPDREIVIGSELTRPGEAFLRGTMSEMRSHFQAVVPRGEFVLVIAGLGMKGRLDER